ncbi:MAG: aminomethyl-transferring glycine dehydrogenase subunit GcvPB, partial [Candidatus Omnitrophota bacterium]
MQLIFEKSRPGRRGFQLPLSDVPKVKTLPEKYCRKIEAQLPEVSELDLVRHFSNLSRLNYSVDTNFYPLGSCTMKYNPKFTEKIAAMDGFANLHPLLPQLSGGGILAQGSLEVLYNTERLLSEITGMAEFTTQ